MKPPMQEAWGFWLPGGDFPEQAGDALAAEQPPAPVPEQAGHYRRWLELHGGTLGGYPRRFPERG